MTDQKATLQRYLDANHEALLWKFDGLSERDLRLPRTPTGTNLLGILKHCVNVEFGYLGPTFGRMIDNPAGLIEESDFDDDPQLDWYATEDETSADVIALAKRVWAFTATTLRELPLDAPGRVPWWGEDRADVTLHQIAVHVIEDIARHVGQADILREGIDGSVGMQVDATNIPDLDWPAYVAKLTALAERH